MKLLSKTLFPFNHIITFLNLYITIRSLFNHCILQGRIYLPMTEELFLTTISLLFSFHIYYEVRTHATS